uniref:Genome polyprotein n=1 Tax=Embiopteran flavi-related virus TaxID=2822562 RepID=A0A8A6RIJ0_9FLAV|nr:polyprotein [Embiopteran flavi-related virus]
MDNEEKPVVRKAWGKAKKKNKKPWAELTAEEKNVIRLKPSYQKRLGRNEAREVWKKSGRNETKFVDMVSTRLVAMLGWVFGHIGLEAVKELLDRFSRAVAVLGMKKEQLEPVGKNSSYATHQLAALMLLVMVAAAQFSADQTNVLKREISLDEGNFNEIVCIRTNRLDCYDSESKKWQSGDNELTLMIPNNTVTIRWGKWTNGSVIVEYPCSNVTEDKHCYAQNPEKTRLRVAISIPEAGQILIGEKMGKKGLSLWHAFEDWMYSRIPILGLFIAAYTLLAGTGLRQFRNAAAMIVLYYLVVGSKACHQVLPTEVLIGKSGSWVDVRIVPETCVTVYVQDEHDIEMSMVDARIDGLLDVEKEIYLEGDQAAIRNTNTCPSGSELKCASYNPSDISITQCYRGSCSRGWDNGCFLFASGGVCSCGVIVAKTKGYVIAPSLNDVVVKLSITVANDTRYVTMDQHGKEEAIKMNGITLGVKCQAINLDAYRDKRILFVGNEEGKGYIVSEGTANGLLTAYRLPGGEWRNENEVIQSDKECGCGGKCLKIKFLHNYQQYLQPTLVGRPTLDMQFNGTTGSIKMEVTLDCAVKIVKLEVTPTELMACAGLHMTGTQFIYPYVHVRYDNILPCKTIPMGTRHGENNVICSDSAGTWEVINKTLFSEVLLKCPSGEIEIKNGNDTLYVDVPGITTLDLVNRTLLSTVRKFFGSSGGAGGDVWALISKIWNTVKEAISGINPFGGNLALGLTLLGVGYVMHIASPNLSLILMLLGGALVADKFWGVKGDEMVLSFNPESRKVSYGVAHDIIWKWKTEVPLQLGFVYGEMMLRDHEQLGSQCVIMVVETLASEALKVLAKTWNVSYDADGHVYDTTPGHCLNVSTSEKIEMEKGSMLLSGWRPQKYDPKCFAYTLDMVTKDVDAGLYSTKIMREAKVRPITICPSDGASPVCPPQNYKVTEYGSSGKRNFIIRGEECEWLGVTYDWESRNSYRSTYRMRCVGERVCTEPRKVKWTVAPLGGYHDQWPCNEVQQGKNNRGHMKPRQMGGEAAMWNCHKQTIKANLQDVEFENQWEGNASLGKSLLYEKIVQPHRLFRLLVRDGNQSSSCQYIDIETGDEFQVYDMRKSTDPIGDLMKLSLGVFILRADTYDGLEEESVEYTKDSGWCDVRPYKIVLDGQVVRDWPGYKPVYTSGYYHDLTWWYGSRDEMPRGEILWRMIVLPMILVTCMGQSITFTQLMTLVFIGLCIPNGLLRPIGFKMADAWAFVGVLILIRLVGPTIRNWKIILWFALGCRCMVLMEPSLIGILVSMGAVIMIIYRRKRPKHDDPIGWTPLILLGSGMVVMTGGPGLSMGMIAIFSIIVVSTMFGPLKVRTYDGIILSDHVPGVWKAGEIDEFEDSFVNEKGEILPISTNYNIPGLYLVVISLVFFLIGTPEIGLVLLTTGLIIEYGQWGQRGTIMDNDLQLVELYRGLGPLTLHIGWGFIYEGVLHTQYHITQGDAITWNETDQKATYVDPIADIATYGGNPKMRKVENGDIVYSFIGTSVNSVTPFRSIIRDVVATVGFFKRFETPPIWPGCSGALVYKFENGKRVPVGMVGTSGGKNGKYTAAIPIIEELGEDEENWIVIGCGKGKTRKIIPKLLHKEITKGQRVWLLAPTRVVAREMAESLEGYKVKYRTPAVKLRPYGALVEAMCHATALRAILGGEKVPNRVIVDEAHFFQPETIALVKYLEGNTRIKATFLTATSPYKMDETSNFEVLKVNRETYEDMVNEIDPTEKTMMFVKSITDGREKLKSLQKRFPTLMFVEMNRKTFDKAQTASKTLKAGIIITTNIAEVGGNFNLDTVIDTQESLVPIETDINYVQLVPRTISQSSLVQRRGRVGRTKPGKYVGLGLIPEVRMGYSNDVTWLEASTLMELLRLGDSSYGSWGEHDKTTKIGMTEKQLDTILSLYREQPFEDGETIYQIAQTILAGEDSEEIDSPCGRKNCLCTEDTYVVWDWRMHDKYARLRGKHASFTIPEPIFLIGKGIYTAWEQGYLGWSNMLVAGMMALNLRRSGCAPSYMAPTGGFMNQTLVWVAFFASRYYEHATKTEWYIDELLLGIGVTLVVCNCMLDLIGSSKHTGVTAQQMIIYFLTMAIVVILAMNPQIISALIEVKVSDQQPALDTTGMTWIWAIREKIDTSNVALAVGIFRGLGPYVYDIGVFMGHERMKRDTNKHIMNHWTTFMGTIAEKNCVPSIVIVIMTISWDGVWFMFKHTQGVILAIAGLGSLLGMGITAGYKEEAVTNRDSSSEHHRLVMSANNGVQNIGAKVVGFLVWTLAAMSSQGTPLGHFIGAGVWLTGSFGLNLDVPSGVLLGDVMRKKGLVFSMIYLLISLCGLRVITKNAGLSFHHTIFETPRTGSSHAEGLKWRGSLGKLVRDEDYNSFRSYKVIEFKRIGEVSRGYAKIRYMDNFLHISGNVADHGAGRGGFTQYLIQKPEVRRVEARSLEIEGHEHFQLDHTYIGYDKVNFIRSDVYNERKGDYDWVINDMGEGRNLENMVIQDLRKLAFYSSWPGRKVLKLLVPWHTQVLGYIKNNYHGYTLCRTPYSRNTTSECYLIPGRIDPEDVAFNVMKVINKRYDEKWMGPMIEVGMKRILAQPTQCIHRTTFSPERIKALGPMEEASLGYSHWKTLGMIREGKTNRPGTVYNEVWSFFLKHLEEAIPGMVNWTMSDVSPEAMQRMFREKVDKTPYMPDEGKKLFLQAYELTKNDITHMRPLTRDEAMHQMRNDAAVGDTRWATMEEAKNDPQFWKEVDEEMENHAKGLCTRGVFETMAKREKKPVSGKASRMIAYYPAVERMCELITFGYANMNHFAGPNVTPEGVGGIPQQMYGETLLKRFNMDPQTGMLPNGALLQTDVAAWDTQVTEFEMDLELEELLRAAQCDRHRRQMTTMYNCYKNPVVKVITISGNKVVLEGIGQRMSGTNPTYTGNTRTNNRHLMCVYKQLYGKFPERGNSAVSGDDSVMKVPYIVPFHEVVKAYAIMGKTLKGRFGEGKNFTHRLQDTWFCSHTYSRVIVNGKDLWMLDRKLSEIFGKARIVLGQYHSGDTALGHAKEYALYLLMTFPHRRACRAIALAIMSVVPDTMIPMGKSTDPRWGANLHLAPGKLHEVFNGIYGTNVNQLTDIKYVNRGRENELGWNTNDVKIRRWSLLLPSSVDKGREVFNTRYRGVTDYLYEMKRYRVGRGLRLD